MIKIKLVNFNNDVTFYNVLVAQEDILNALQKSNDKVIFQLISGGGDIAAAMSLYYWLESIEKGRIEILALSHIASAANLLLLTHHPTYSYPHCSFMFHPCFVKMEFDVRNQDPIIKDSTKRIDDYWNVYAKKSKGAINADWIAKNQHIYLYPKDLVKLKILDGIIGE